MRRTMLRAAALGTPAPGPLPALARTAISGMLTQVRADAIVVHAHDGEKRIGITAETATWLGARASPAALRSGDPVIVRHRPAEVAAAGTVARAPAVAERIWARIGRVGGTIVAADGREFLVDTGLPGRAVEHVVIAAPSFRQVQVRFPRLAPGYLIDVIGTRHGDYLLAVAPATAQPPRIAGRPPVPPPGRHLAFPISGTAVWHEARAEPSDLLGLSYPALDPDTAGQPSAAARDCVQLPYLSLGSVARIRNECASLAAVLPVTGCAANSRMFCDRCVLCGTSPRGRVADLTAAAFVELGGNLEDGCFNATLTLAY